MTLRELLLIGAVLGTQGGCTCGSAYTTMPMFDAGHDSEPDAPVVTTVCNNAQLAVGCVARPCKVTATGNPLPPGASLTIAAKPVPPTLAGDSTAPVLCSLAIAGGPKSVSNLTLWLEPSATPAASAALFQYVSPVLSELVGTSGPSGKDVVGLVTAPGQFGATEKPGDWALSGVAGVQVSSSATEAELLMNLSSQPNYGSFFDGKHLLVSNGPRVLIYDGIPASPSVKPSVVIGQPDLDTLEPQTTSSLFGGSGGVGLWSDGKRLVVADSYRILVWNSFPTKSLTPADVVLGQPDFASNDPNVGGESAASLNDVWAVDSDGTQLVAADLRNNRVLVWKTFPTTVGQPADFEIGQPNFGTGAANAGAVPIYEAFGVALDPSGLFLTGFFNPGLVHVAPVATSNPGSEFSVLGLSTTAGLGTSLYSAGPVGLVPGGGLAVRDTYLFRLAMLRTIPKGPAPSIDFVLGQPDVTRVVESPVSASVVSSNPATPSPSLGSGGLLTVPDLQRVLVYDSPPSYNFEPASRVIGQAGFSTNGPVDYRGISGSTLASPADVAIGSGTIAVADRGNNRVLLYQAASVTTDGVPAAVALGQPDEKSYVPNLDQRTPSAARLSGPAGVALDGTHLIVADTENHRVLIWKSVPTTTGAPADLVLGQADFAGRRPNRGRGDADGDGFSDPGADGLFYPIGVASNGSQLFVADRLNNRVLVWKTFPVSNGQPADTVLGQPDFVTPRANRGNGGYTFVANGLNLPTGVTLVGTSLWVADTENNRLVRWDQVLTTPKPGAVVGQASLTSVSNPNYEVTSAIGFPTTPPPPTTATTVLRPRSVVVAGGVLYVTEMDSNRVHMFDAVSLSPMGELGQASDTAGTPNTNGVTAATMTLPLGAASDGTDLWIADSGNHRVLAFAVGSTPATGASASLTLGQVSLLTAGFNQSSTAADGATSRPHGLAVADGKLYVADTGNSRVLVMKTPVAAGDEPVMVYGQPNGTLALQNAGTIPSASTLNEPRGVFVEGIRLLVADTANNRVLVYGSAKSTTATLVLGQKDFASVSPNAGGGVTASSLQAPGGVFSDGVSLWVADSGNHRVLLWKAFPTRNGQAADLVLGQGSFSGSLGNRGGSQASPNSLSFPADVKVIEGVLYVADSGNNRVVMYSKPPSVSGVGADGVLGQPNLTSRIAAVLPTDLAHMAGPVAIAQDQENLYVADRDLGRAVVFHLGTMKTGGEASEVLGSARGLVVSGPGGIAAERTGLFTSRVYVSDSGIGQIDVLASVGRLVSP